MSNRQLPYQAYRIVFQGQLDERRLAWFPGMEVRYLPDGNTELYGSILDVASLHGMLTRIGDLGLPLLLVLRVDYEGEIS